MTSVSADVTCVPPLKEKVCAAQLITSDAGKYYS